MNERVRELQQQLGFAGVDGEVILVLDGGSCSDLASAPAVDLHPVRIIALPQNVGKAAAISLGAETATGEVLAFADMRQRWAEDALSRLLERFDDQSIGAVTGDLMIESGPANQGVGFYWRYEKWIRHNEGIYDSVVGATGAIAAVRRNLFHCIPAGTVLDDVYWPLKVAMTGHRVVHEASAKAFDRFPESATDEFRRKIRTLAGNFQLVCRLPAAILPGKNPIFWQFISHKLLRLAVPWLLLAAFIAAGLIARPAYQLLFWMQAAGYSGLVAVAFWAPLRRFRIASAALSFGMLNLAAWMAFWVWISGRTTRSWNVVNYAGQQNTELAPMPTAGCQGQQ